MVVRREPEWDDYSRNEALAGLLADRRRCGSCGAPDALVPIEPEDRDVTWGDGRKFRVTAWRCLACMAENTVSRDFHKRYEKHEPTPGVFSPTAGVRFFATEIDQPEPGQEVIEHGGAS